jgi:hypothetical protein
MRNDTSQGFAVLGELELLAGGKAADHHRVQPPTCKREALS